jgi:hypothetical protein
VYPLQPDAHTTSTVRTSVICWSTISLVSWSKLWSAVRFNVGYLNERAANDLHDGNAAPRKEKEKREEEKTEKEKKKEERGDLNVRD